MQLQHSRTSQNSSGQILIVVLVSASIFLILITALVGWGSSSLLVSHKNQDREVAFQIAEAGIDYYRWHLAHARDDFKDGTLAAGPYVHDFNNKDGVKIGTFSLTITPPPVGSTIVTITSVGRVVADPSLTRTIETRLAISSFAKFAVVANGNMRFGAGTEVFGPIHSNGGIRFDALAHNVVTSARASYIDPDPYHGTISPEFGVHTHVNAPPGSGTNDAFRPAEAPPSVLPARPDVFESGRQIGVPAVDFAGVTADLAQIKTDAAASGRYFANSGALGYRVLLKTNDTFDLYQVNTLVNAPGNCTPSGNPPNGQAGWGSWSISGAGSAQTFLANYAFPSNGLLFLEDNVWVEGQINTARLTIASARFPDNVNTRTSITVNNNLLYTNYDGQDVLALIAQNNFNVGLVSQNTLRIDAALMAQNGRAGRYYYTPSGCANDSKSTLTLYGMIGTNQRYGFAYTNGTGYATRNIIYDANLLYGPPPSFPLTSDQYSILSWQEK